MANPTTTDVAGFSGDNFIDAMTTGYRWTLGADRAIDWSFSNGFAGEFWTDPTSVQSHLSDAFAIVSVYANVRFNYVGFFSTPTAAASAGSDINVSLDGANRFFTS